MSYAAYAGIQKATESSRDLEIRAISFITGQMVNANKSDAEPMARIRALNGNIRLWSLLTHDLANPDNPLPEAVKASYISIGIFVRRKSLAALDAHSDLSVLIRINADVLDALDHQRRLAA
jgi:flagellar protein FlaF